MPRDPASQLSPGEKVVLHQFPSGWGLPCPSPFCLKVETYLRMAKVPFEITMGDIRQAPKKKLPFITVGADKIADSSFILEYLKERYGDRLDAELTEEQRLQSQLLVRWAEEYVYWLGVYFRWVHPVGFAVVKRDLFGELPWPLRPLILFIVRRKLRRDLVGQGLGRHSEEELTRLADRSVDLVVSLLGDKRYFMGDRPTSVDATMFAFLVNSIWIPVESPLKTGFLAQSSVSRYCERMRDEFFPDMSFGPERSASTGRPAAGPALANQAP